jgi:hypothetical protein
MEKAISSEVANLVLGGGLLLTNPSFFHVNTG